MLKQAGVDSQRVNGRGMNIPSSGPWYTAKAGGEYADQISLRSSTQNKGIVATASVRGRTDPPSGDAEDPKAKRIREHPIRWVAWGNRKK